MFIYNYFSNISTVLLEGRIVSYVLHNFYLLFEMFIHGRKYSGSKALLSMMVKQGKYLVFVHLLYR